MISIQKLRESTLMSNVAGQVSSDSCTNCVPESMWAEKNTVGDSNCDWVINGPTTAHMPITWEWSYFLFFFPFFFLGGGLGCVEKSSSIAWKNSGKMCCYTVSQNSTQTTTEFKRTHQKQSKRTNGTVPAASAPVFLPTECLPEAVQ